MPVNVSPDNVKFIPESQKDTYTGDKELKEYIISEDPCILVKNDVI